MSSKDYSDEMCTNFGCKITPILSSEFKKPLKEELAIRGIKILDIAYIFSFYAAAGFFLSILLEKIFPKYSENKYKNMLSGRILLEICIQFAAIGIVVYIIKNIFELVPFPFEGIYGYEHKKVKELQNAMPLIYTILYFQISLRDKLMILLERFIKK
jgi:hypothetical protein